MTYGIHILSHLISRFSRSASRISINIYTRTLSLLLLFAAGIFLPVMSPGAEKAAPMPSVLWIMLDDCRADALGCYGKPWAHTPHMDAIAREGVRFQTAIVQNPVCTPSRMCMKTGLYAHQTGVMAMGRPAQTPGKYRQRVRAESGRQNLLRAWTRHGITPQSIGKMHVFPEDWNQLAGFGALLNHHGEPTRLLKPEWHDRRLSVVRTKTHQWMVGGLLDVPAREFRQSRIGDLAVEQLTQLTSRDEPFFLRISFHAPHVACFVCPSHFVDPATIALPVPTEQELASKPQFERKNLHTYAGAPDLTRAQIDLARGTYYGMVRLVDDQVGRIMRTLKESGRMDDVIVVINSDQGFQLGEHGVWKKRDLYDTNVCVPFVIKAPGRVPAGKVVRQPVEMVDFVPTLMDLCGLPPPHDVAGRSLLPLLDGRADTWREACFSEHDHSEDMYDELRDGGGRRVMVRTKKWKLVFFWDERITNKEDGALYQLSADPFEQRNLYGDPDYQRIIDQLTQMTTEWDRES